MIPIVDPPRPVDADSDRVERGVFESEAAQGVREIVRPDRHPCVLLYTGIMSPRWMRQRSSHKGDEGMERERALQALKQEQPFDLLVIGGGATGCGIALDAASRGLRTALIEKNDFAEGTSSRSTKLIHGGVRYLEAAVRRLDRGQYRLVREGLRERAVLLRNAPHLTRRLSLVTPLYEWMEVPYVLAGLKLYDLLAGKKGIGHSRLIGPREALRRFPMLKGEGLKAGVLYYDGQFNDARTALALAMTARRHGAVAANHLEVVALCRQGGRLCGVQVSDRIGGEEFTVEARGVINATGPFADRLRRMDEPGAAPILTVSSGIHIVLDGRFAPPQTGLMIPETEDRRILFILPWQGHALVGTTDEPSRVSDHPRPTKEEIAYLLRHVGRYFNLKVSESDVKASWSGLRPLVHDLRTVATAALTRDHFIEMSPAGLLTIAGGKWTTYRRMAQDVVDRAVGRFGLAPKGGCRTDGLVLEGGEGFDPEGEKVLAREFGIDGEVALHLHRAYGAGAAAVAGLAGSGLGRRLHPDHPFVEAEAVHAVRHEFAQRPLDVLARRTSLALLDRDAALAALPRVVELMAGELGWDEERCREETRVAEGMLQKAI